MKMSCQKLTKLEMSLRTKEEEEEEEEVEGEEEAEAVVDQTEKREVKKFKQKQTKINKLILNMIHLEFKVFNDFY